MAIFVGASRGVSHAAAHVAMHASVAPVIFEEKAMVLVTSNETANLLAIVLREGKIEIFHILFSHGKPFLYRTTSAMSPSRSRITPDLRSLHPRKTIF